LTPFSIRYKNDYGFAGSALSGYGAALFYLNGEKVFHKTDAEYQAQSFNNNRYVLAKVKDNKLKYGILDENGDTLVDFEYDFVATYVSGLSIAKADGKYYKLDAGGEAVKEITDIKDNTSQFAFNSYIYISGSKIGLKNYNESVLVPAVFDQLIFQGFVDGELFVTLVSGTVHETYHVY
jgi:hypothetical protein